MPKYWYLNLECHKWKFRTQICKLKVRIKVAHLNFYKNLVITSLDNAFLCHFSLPDHPPWCYLINQWSESTFDYHAHKTGSWTTPCSAGCLSSQPTLFFSHTKPAPSTNNFLSQQISTSHHPQPAANKTEKFQLAKVPLYKNSAQLCKMQQAARDPGSRCRKRRTHRARSSIRACWLKNLTVSCHLIFHAYIRMLRFAKSPVQTTYKCNVKWLYQRATP